MRAGPDSGEWCWIIMISWVSVAVNALWVVGLAMILGALSYHDWLAREHGVSLRQALSRRGFVVAAAIGLTLVCLGLAGTAGGWERVVWLGLALFFAAQAWRAASPTLN